MVGSQAATHHRADYSEPSTPPLAQLLNDPAQFTFIDAAKKVLEETTVGAIAAQVLKDWGMDVYEEESDYFFEDFSNKVITDDVLARLLSFNNVMVTSHQGFFTQEALRSIAITTLENIRDFFIEHKISNGVCYKCG